MVLKYKFFYVNKLLSNIMYNDAKIIFATRGTSNELIPKIEEEEKQIRHDPVARVTTLLKRVFSKN